MARGKKFKGLKESGKKSANTWFAFPLIGFILVFCLCLLGSSLLTNNIFIGFTLAAFFCVAIFFVVQYLENLKAEGSNQIPLWVAFVFLSIGATSVGYHYLHVFHSDKSEYLRNEKVILQKRITLVEEYINLNEGVLKLENCETSTMKEDRSNFEEELKYLNGKLNNLGDPFQFLRSLGLSGNEKKIGDLKKDIDLSISKYKKLNDGLCSNIKMSDDFQAHEESTNLTGSNTLSNSLANANWLWFLGLLLISSFLILTPYFIAENATDILKLRKRK